MISIRPIPKYILAIFVLAVGICGQDASLAAARSAAVERGSQTAKGGFRNENEIRDSLNNWRQDADARAWLGAMRYEVTEIASVIATKPRGKKSDVEVRITTIRGDMRREGISIKLVSGHNGYNQIDKRWLGKYASAWNMPQDVLDSLKLFVGETPPTRRGRDEKRMYLNELEADAQRSIINFFTERKDEIVSDLIAGDGPHAAGWFMVASKAGGTTRWIIRPSADAARFFGKGTVEITRNGNLRIGRITMQRKGGDAGRDTARMLQFKINPALLFDLK